MKNENYSTLLYKTGFSFPYSTIEERNCLLSCFLPADHLEKNDNKHELLAFLENQACKKFLEKVGIDSSLINLPAFIDIHKNFPNSEPFLNECSNKLRIPGDWTASLNNKQFTPSNISIIPDLLKEYKNKNKSNALDALQNSINENNSYLKTLKNTGNNNHEIAIVTKQI